MSQWTTNNHFEWKSSSRSSLIKLESEKGFTLIESLIVLSMFLLIVSLSVLMIQPKMQSLDENMFFTKFKADILFAQQYALANQTYVNVFIPQGSHRYMLADGYTMILDHEFSERYSIIERTMPRTFQFHPNGNINMFGYFYVQTDNSKYKVMFQIGRGRFYVTEE